MGIISVQEIQNDLNAFIGRVEAGEAFVVVRGEHQVAEVRPLGPGIQPRPFGLCVGSFKVPNDFDSLLPEGILKEFEGS